MAGLKKIGKLGSNTPRPPATVPAILPPPPTGPRPMPDLGRPTMAPRGPRHLRLGQKRTTGTGGPGAAPATWEGTQPEWVWHWGSRKYFYQQERLGPLDMPWGGISWTYQVPEGGPNTRDPGSSVSDFVYLTPGGQQIIVRIETEYFHTQQGGAQFARDLYLTTHAGASGDRVARPHDSQFMSDVTGATAIRLLADILAGHPAVGQIGGGVVQPARYGDFELGISA